MPIISAFSGIVIRMFYQDHEPPHFHAEHSGQQAKFDFRGQLIVRTMRSQKALRLIKQWAAIHRVELEGNWVRMKRGQALERVAPLE
jgi:hypothetical protein